MMPDAPAITNAIGWFFLVLAVLEFVALVALTVWAWRRERRQGNKRNDR